MPEFGQKPIHYGVRREKTSLKTVYVTPEARAKLKELAKKHHRKMWQEFSWIMDTYSGQSDVCELLVPVRLMHKLTQIAAAFRRSPLDQLEWMLDNELRKRVELVEEMERILVAGGEMAEEQKTPRLVVTGVVERELMTATGA